MRKTAAAAISVLIAASALVGFKSYQDSQEQIDQKQLRTMLQELGYEVKDLVTDPGKEKYTVTITTGGLDIPVGYEISPSKNYIWLTVNLGAPFEDASPKNIALLKDNATIQPAFFYVTKSNLLMMGLPVDNRGLTNAIMRQRTDFIAGKAVSTQSSWKK